MITVKVTPIELPFTKLKLIMAYCVLSWRLKKYVNRSHWVEF